MNKISSLKYTLLTALLIMPLGVLSSVDIIKVKSEGMGGDLNQAIDKALVQAISMVNGKSVESETLLKTRSQSTSTDKGNEFSNSKDLQDQIKSRTNGIVDGYKILSQSKTDRGNVKVCLLYTSPSPRDQRGSRMPSSA